MQFPNYFTCNFIDYSARSVWNNYPSALSLNLWHFKNEMVAAGWNELLMTKITMIEKNIQHTQIFGIAMSKMYNNHAGAIVNFIQSNISIFL